MNPVRRGLLLLLSRMPAGQLTILEPGRRTVLGAGEPRATVRINSARVWRSLLHGSRGLAEAYADELWETEDLSAVIRVAARNAPVFDRWRRRLAWLRVPAQALRGIRTENSRRRSRQDIAAHYDLGNDLFELMLDETMMYSCAYFPEEGVSLGEASRAKLEMVCEKLDLGPDDHVLEIGTGWGGFAVHAASTRGCRVTTTTISRAQYDHARRRVEEAGLSELVTVLCQDYRDLRGVYDKLVSIEMIEAVGWRNLPTFFRRCSELLRPAGAMLLQSIVIEDQAYEVEKASRSFIRSYIFPGGTLPSLEVMARCVAHGTDLRLAHLEELTPHYVRTLRHWRRNFEAATEELQRLGYDNRFRRLWRLYLAYCEGGFAERRIGLVHMLLAKPGQSATGAPHVLTSSGARSGPARGERHRSHVAAGRSAGRRHREAPSPGPHGPAPAR
jgi:cyclopropane-fatty-acyl-phospholipid synthase